MEPSNEASRSRTRVALIVISALAAGVLVWLIAVHDDQPNATHPPPVPEAGAGPKLVTSGSLSALQNELGHPVYWAGEQPGAPIELTLTRDDRVYVRYLADGAEPGDPRPDFLTIATYPVDDAYGSLERQSRKPGATVAETSDGAIVVANDASPTSVYVAYPQQDLQIEVFDPDSRRALELAASGDVRPAA